MPVVPFLEPPVSTIPEPLHIQHFIIPANPKAFVRMITWFYDTPCHVTTGICLSATSLSGSCIPIICPCRINLTHHKIPTTLLAFPNITVMFAVKFHTTRPTTFLVCWDCLFLPGILLLWFLSSLSKTKASSTDITCVLRIIWRSCLIVLHCCWFILYLQHLLSSPVIPPRRTPCCGDLLMDFLQHVDNLAE